MWQKISKHDYVIDYVDKAKPSSRYSGHPGRLTCDADEIVLEPEAGQLTGVKWFAIFFIPLFSLTAYFFIPGKQKWLGVLAGPTIGTLTFGFIYYLIKREVDAGPYLRFIAKSDEICLPRWELSFNKETVSLQWITGRHESDEEVTTDLNLIVQEKDGSKHRYYVMSGPYRKYVKQFAEHAGIPVVEINMGWRGRTDTDRETKIQ